MIVWPISNVWVLKVVMHCRFKPTLSVCTTRLICVSTDVTIHDVMLDLAIFKKTELRFKLFWD